MPIISKEEAAEYCGVSVNTLTRHVENSVEE